jgi:hypothetical protein
MDFVAGDLEIVKAVLSTTRADQKWKLLDALKSV